MAGTVVYCYDGCSTCRKARAWLRQCGIAIEERPIRERPPSKAELKRMLKHYGGELKRLFNVSSRDYREAGLKDRLPELSTSEAIALLHGNGNLIKRPFALGERGGAVGFKEEEWRRLFG